MSIIFKNEMVYRRTTVDRRIIITYMPSYTGLPSVLNHASADMLSARQGTRRARLQA